jgi:hypothetical protein
LFVSSKQCQLKTQTFFFQDELVRLNLRIKSLNVSFPNCVNREEMEALNSNVRRQLESMRQNLEKLRNLASKQKTVDAKKMLLADADSHADELVLLLNLPFSHFNQNQ